MSRILTGSERRDAMEFLKAAQTQAESATCLRARCGSVIVANGNYIIGRGYNHPPGHLESMRFCDFKKEDFHKRVTDKTCCVHAEIEAVDSALEAYASKLSGSRLYFMRVDDKGAMTFAGEPYCTSCSKHTLNRGVAEFVLYREEGIVVYDTEEYHILSRNYQGEKNLKSSKK